MSSYGGIMKKLASIILLLLSESLFAKTSHCDVIEDRIPESIASCLAVLDGSLAGAVLDVRLPLLQLDGKMFLTRSEADAARLKDNIVENLKTLAGSDIKIFASSKAEKNSPRIISLDLIVSPETLPLTVDQEKNLYFLQSGWGVLHHDNGGAVYTDIYFSALRSIKTYRLGFAIEKASDDSQMDLLSIKMVGERPFKLASTPFSLVPGVYVGTLSTTSEISLDLGASVSLLYYVSDRISLCLLARRGRFTGAASAGLEVTL